jgi:hypothetical protein
MALEEKRVLESGPTAFLGVEAWRLRTSGLVSGVRVQYLHLAFLRRGFAYQAVAWHAGEPRPEGEAALEAFARSVTLLPGAIRGRSRARPTEETAGIGWRVHEGAFESAAYRFSIRPPEGWRLALGRELERIDATAEVALVRADPEAYLVLRVERAAGVDREEHVERMREMFAKAVGAPPGEERIPLLADGREVVLRRHLVGGGAPRAFLHGVHFEGDLCFQANAWYLAGARERAEPRVLEALRALEFLDRREAGELADALASGPDPRARIGEGWSLRGGVYRDFVHGFTWTIPPGWWRVLAGPAARAQADGASLHFVEPSLGITGFAFAGEASGATAEAVLARQAARLFEDPDSIGEPEPIPLGIARGLAVSGGKTVDGAAIRYRLLVAVHGNTVLRVVLGGTRANLKSAASSVERAIAAFEFPGEPLRERVTDDEEHRDERTGFLLARPGPDWTFRDLTVTAFAPLGAMVAWERDEVVVAAGGFAASEGPDDAAAAVEFAGPLLADLAGVRLAEPRILATEVGGAPAFRLEWPVSPRVEALVLRRDLTRHFVAVVGAGQEGPTLEEALAGHRLLD